MGDDVVCTCGRCPLSAIAAESTAQRLEKVNATLLEAAKEIAVQQGATISQLRDALAECEADHPMASELEDARAVIAMLSSEYARRYEDWKARTAVLEAGLAEACDIGMRINEQAGAKGDADDVRLLALRSLLTPKETT